MLIFSQNQKYDFNLSKNLSYLKKKFKQKSTIKYVICVLVSGLFIFSVHQFFFWIFGHIFFDSNIIKIISTRLIFYLFLLILIICITLTRCRSMGFIIVPWKNSTVVKWRLNKPSNSRSGGLLHFFFVF